MNTVNSKNFNQTMGGYVDYALDFANKVLQRDYGYRQEQIEEIEKVIRQGLNWAKNDMTMADARVYQRKY